MPEQTIQERRESIPVDDIKAMSVRCTLCLAPSGVACRTDSRRPHVARLDYYRIVRDREAHPNDYGI